MTQIVVNPRSVAEALRAMVHRVSRVNASFKWHYYDSLARSTLPRETTEDGEEVDTPNVSGSRESNPTLAIATSKEYQRRKVRKAGILIIEAARNIDKADAILDKLQGEHQEPTDKPRRVKNSEFKEAERMKAKRDRAGRGFGES